MLNVEVQVVESARQADARSGISIYETTLF